MNAPTFGAGAEFAAGIAHMLTRTGTIQYNAGALTPPAGADNWLALHEDVACVVKTLVTDEGRERRMGEYTLAADAIEVVAEGWLDDVTSAHRFVLDDGRVFDILSVGRVGHSDFTKLYAQRRAT